MCAACLTVCLTFCEFVPGVLADGERSAPLLIYYNKCQNPARGCLSSPFTETLSHTQNTTQEAVVLSVTGCVCVRALPMAEGGELKSWLLWANWTAANWIITLTSSEQWRSERKEGRGKKCSLLGWLVSCTVGMMKARVLKMYKDVLMTCFVR